MAGGADESDLELLTTTAWLTKNVRLSRAYFSAFHPIRDTPLENKPAVDPLREHRLYQASYLMRDYGFGVEELPFMLDHNLPLPLDPKLAWARTHLAEERIEINRADRSQLLRVPGIGIKGAEAILAARRTAKLQDLENLKRLGVAAEKAAPFILLNGKRAPNQLTLF
ncbi:MAG: helix-hairpin-helix domain-containing protein [Candidatus Binatia bacterium]